MAENNEYKFAPITDLNLKQMGVQALADRPNATQQYGQSGLSPTQLKRWFDKLAELLSRKVNELQSAINGADAAKYIGIALGEYKTLDDLLEGMQDGSFAESILKLFPKETATEDQLDTLQNIIFDIAKDISDNKEELERLDKDKLSKVTDAATYKRLYGVDEKGEQIMLTAAASPSGQMPLYSENGALIAKMTPISGMPGGEYPSEVVNLAFINELRKHIGAGVRFSMDPTTYIVSIDVVNIDGQVIYHTELDLPLEEFIVDADYKDGKIILVLRSGKEIEMPVANIVNGLVTEAKHKADIDAVNNKIDAALNAYIVDVYNLVGGDYVDYS
jgi:hypothetical protein